MRKFGFRSFTEIVCWEYASYCWKRLISCTSYNRSNPFLVILHKLLFWRNILVNWIRSRIYVETIVYGMRSVRFTLTGRPLFLFWPNSICFAFSGTAISIIFVTPEYAYMLDDSCTTYRNGPRLHYLVLLSLRFPDKSLSSHQISATLPIFSSANSPVRSRT